MSDHRWLVLEGARRAIIEALGCAGVTRVETVAAFPGQTGVAVWLGTTTDVEAGRVRDSGTAPESVREVLAAAGLGVQELDGLSVVVQSQETVDREYGGSWFNAVR